MIAGTLELQMLSNIAQIQSEIATGTAGITASMTSIESAIAGVKNAFMGLLAGMSVGARRPQFRGSQRARDC